MMKGREKVILLGSHLSEYWKEIKKDSEEYNSNRSRAIGIVSRIMIGIKLLFFIFIFAGSTFKVFFSLCYYSPVFFSAYSYSLFPPDDVSNANNEVSNSQELMWKLALILIVVFGLMALIFIYALKNKIWLDFFALPLLVADVGSYTWSIRDEIESTPLTTYKYIGLLFTILCLVLIAAKIVVDYKTKRSMFNQSQ